MVTAHVVPVPRLCRVNLWQDLFLGIRNIRLFPSGSSRLITSKGLLGAVDGLMLNTSDLLCSLVRVDELLMMESPSQPYRLVLAFLHTHQTVLRCEDFYKGLFPVG